MTCIVGIVHNGKVWMGSDGRSTFNYYQAPIVQSKFGRIGEMLLACREHRVLGRYCFKPWKFLLLGNPTRMIIFAARLPSG